MEKIVDLLGNVAKITKGEQTAESFALMATVLSKYPFEDVQKAILYGLENEWTFFPTVKEIVALIKPKAKLSGSESFDKIMAHIKRFGSSEKMKSLTALEQASLRAVGGLKGLGMSQESDIKWKRKEFIDSFEMYYEKPDYQREFLIENSKIDNILNEVSERLE